LAIVVQARKDKQSAESQLSPFSVINPEISSPHCVEDFDAGKQVRTGHELIEGYDIVLREKPAAAILVVKGPQ